MPLVIVKIERKMAIQGDVFWKGDKGLINILYNNVGLIS